MCGGQGPVGVYLVGLAPSLRQQAQGFSGPAQPGGDEPVDPGDVEDDERIPSFGGELAYRFTDSVEGELKLDAFYYRYSDFPPLSSRTGANTGIGVSVTY